jgi:FAD/FMN-containing dehydrogenase
MAAEDGGARLRVRPGTILNHANAILKPLGRRLGPDPASADVATIGGVIANNAGGMRCTLERNSYHTVSSLTLVLASGTVIDTAAPDAEVTFAKAEPELAQGLMQLREELLADDELAQRIRHKFSIRNTNGYALSALLDADTPLGIFRRLMVGSEGTLAFMAEAVIDTIPAPAATTVSWIVLPSISEATALVPGLVALGAEAVELMLAPALAAAAQAFPGTPQYWKTLDPQAAGLLVEFRADSPAALDAAVAKASAQLAGANLVHPLEFTRDEDLIELYWRVRDGLLGIVGKQRPEGTALVIEDVCFPPDRIADGAKDQGYIRGRTWMAATTCDALWEWSGHGAMPVVIDAASCTNGLLDDVKNYLDAEHRARLEQITLLDAIAWCDSLFPALTVSERIERAAVHPTCSTAHLGLTKTLGRLAGRLAGDVLVPVGTTCCGTAGDRGLLHPELVVSATRDEKTGLDETPAQAYLSANRTCEMGLRQATGHPYESFVFLLEELTRPT